MTSLVEKIYRAAANVGLLKACVWQPSAGGAQQSYPVGWSAADLDVLSGLTSSTEFVMTYPNSCFIGLAARETVQVGGVAFQVREVLALRDGSEMQVKLMRV